MILCHNGTKRDSTPNFGRYRKTLPTDLKVPCDTMLRVGTIFIESIILHSWRTATLTPRCIIAVVIQNTWFPLLSNFKAQLKNVCFIMRMLALRFFLINFVIYLILITYNDTIVFGLIWTTFKCHVIQFNLSYTTNIWHCEMISESQDNRVCDEVHGL